MHSELTYISKFKHGTLRAMCFKVSRFTLKALFWSLLETGGNRRVTPAVSGVKRFKGERE